MKIGFFAFILIFFLTILVYVIVRGTQALSFSPLWKSIYIVLSVTLFLSFFVGMILGNYFPLSVAKTITFLGDSFLIVMIYLVFAFLATDIILFNKIFHFLKQIRFRSGFGQWQSVYR